MSASYNKIDYRLRIAKSVERRMLCSLFQSLDIFQPVYQYNYIGFGSVSFLDFALFHKVLGISNMISIEQEEHDRQRFEFNKPYGCIDIKYGESKDVLPTLDLNSKSMIWLDYDDKLNTEILSDLDLVFNRSVSGSFVCLTFNAQQDDEHDGVTRIEKLINRIDKKYFPKYIYDDYTLNKTKLRKAYYDIINNVITEVIASRIDNGENINVQQFVFFNYNDGAEMNTIGWLFYNDSDAEKLNHIENKKFNFVRNSSNSFEINIPLLTYKEMRAIEERFPNIDHCVKHFGKNGFGHGILKKIEIENYFHIYKNFSLFAEITL